MANGSFGGGAGTSANPYLIEDALDLNAIRNSASSYYKLVNHINLSSYATGTGWNPIPSFTGTLDGNGFTIQNLYISNSASSNLGLFISLGANGTIINLGLENVLIIGNGTVGGFAGSVVGAGASIRRSYIRGHITATSSFGGFVGSNTQNFVLENCLSYCNLNTTNTGTVNGGGLIGTTSGSGTIKNCLYAGYINGTGTAYGATVGAFTATTFTNVFYDSSLTSKFIASSGAALTATTAKQVTSYTNWHLESIQFRDIKINTKQAINLNALTPVAYWALNGNTNDGYSTKNATAVSMSYINFGTASVANITNSSNRYGYDNIVASNTNLSFCGWYKINPSTKSGNIYDNYVGGFTTKSANGIAYGISTSGKYAIVFCGTTPSNPTGGHLEFESSVGVENKFVHLCLTKEGNTVRLYLNGSKIVENTITHNVGLNFLNTYLNAGGFYRTVSALEYDVMVFNRVLTEQEIQSISTTPIEELVDYQNVSVWKFETGSYPGLWYEKNPLVLVKSNNNYKRYKISTDSWLDIQSTYPTQLQFAKNGFRNPSLISRAKWKELWDIGNIDILTLIPENKNKTYLELGTRTSGNGRSFNGTNQYFTFSNPIIPTGAKTIKMKFKVASAPPAGTYPTLLSNASTDNQNFRGAIVLQPTTGKIYYTTRTANVDTAFVISPNNVCDNLWHELTVIWYGTTDTNSLNMYIDGNLVAQSTPSSTNEPSTLSNLNIGRHPGNNNYFTGSLDDIQILGSTGNVIAHWKMNETSTTSNLIDSSGETAYTGTQVNSPGIVRGEGPVILADNYSRIFNGTTDHVQFSNPIIPRGSKTISFDIFRNGLPPAISGNEYFILGNVWDGTKNGMLFSLNTAGKIVCALFNSSGTNFIMTSNTSVCDNRWHSIRFTWDGTVTTNAVKLFIDNNTTPDVTTTATSTELNPPTDNFSIGVISASTSDARKFSGYLKNLKIYKGVVSSSDSISNTDTISMPQLIGGGNSEVTLNPSDTISSHTSLSNNNLTLSHVNNGGNYGAARTSQSITSGKWYWEATINNYASLNYVPRLRVGIMTKNVSLDSIYTNSANVAAYDGTYATNDVIGVAVDTVAGTVQFYRNNTLAQTLTDYNFSTAFYPAGGTYGNTPWGAGSHDQITFNFGLSTFVYSPPSGYSSLATNPYQAFGTITVSSRTTDGQFEAYRVFDGNAAGSNFYESNTEAMPHWIKVDFAGDARIVNQFTLSSGDAENLRMPYNFTFRGSNNNSTWTTLYTGTNVLFNLNETKTFTFSNQLSYRYYDLNVTSNAPGSSNANILRIYEMNLYTNKLVLNLPFGESNNSTIVSDKGPYSFTLTQSGSLGSSPATELFYRFNGREDRINYPVQIIPVGAKVIQFDIRKSSSVNSSGAEVIFSTMAGTNQYGTVIGLVTNGYVYFQNTKGTLGTNNFNITGAINVCDGNWHTVKVEWNGTTTTNAVKIYIDGNLDVQGTALSTETTASTSSLFVGCLTDLSVPFSGDLKNLYIDAYYSDKQIVLDTDSIIDITPTVAISTETEISNTISNQSASVITEVASDIIPTVRVTNEIEIANTISNQSAAVITESAQDIVPTVSITNETEISNTISNQSAAVITETSQDITPTVSITTEAATGNSLFGNTSFTTAVPFAKLIKANGDISLESIEVIDSLQVTASTSGAGVVKMIASSDSGVTWKSYYNGAWTTVTDTDLSDVKTKGMSPTVFSALTNTEWQQLISSSKKVRFAYYLEIDSVSDSASTDKLVLQFDALGSWKAMPYGGDWEYEMISLKRARVYIYANGSYKINY